MNSTSRMIFEIKNALILAGITDCELFHDVARALKKYMASQDNPEDKIADFFDVLNQFFIYAQKEQAELVAHYKGKNISEKTIQYALLLCCVEEIFKDPGIHDDSARKAIDILQCYIADSILTSVKKDFWKNLFLQIVNVLSSHLKPQLNIRAVAFLSFLMMNLARFYNKGAFYSQEIIVLQFNTNQVHFASNSSGLLLSPDTNFCSDNGKDFFDDRGQYINVIDSHAMLSYWDIMLYVGSALYKHAQATFNAQTYHSMCSAASFHIHDLVNLYSRTYSYCFNPGKGEATISYSPNHIMNDLIVSFQLYVIVYIFTVIPFLLYKEINYDMGQCLDDLIRGKDQSVKALTLMGVYENSCRDVSSAKPSAMADSDDKKNIPGSSKPN